MICARKLIPNHTRDISTFLKTCLQNTTLYSHITHILSMIRFDVSFLVNNISQEKKVICILSLMHSHYQGSLWDFVLSFDDDDTISQLYSFFFFLWLPARGDHPLVPKQHNHVVFQKSKRLGMGLPKKKIYYTCFYFIQLA